MNFEPRRFQKLLSVSIASSKGKMMQVKRVQGFTRLELLTTLTLVMLLMVPLLPAMQRARADARLMQCKNNLKQLGLAMHNYHDTFLMMAPGWISKRMGGEGHSSTGWQSMILPFLDQAPLYNQLNLTEPVYESPGDLLKLELTVYRCPADSLAGTNSIRGGWGTSNYSGNYGAIPIPRWSTNFSTESFWPGNTSSRLVRKPDGREGIFAINAGSRFRDIKDGTSNTLMISEKSVLSGGGIWPGPRSNYHESDVVSDASFASPLNRSETGFSSRHMGVINFLLCDGAVRAVPVSIESLPYNPKSKEAGVLQKLAGRADGMHVQLPEGTF